ncbi:unannotated protein [freshwater metagenome]|uniref:Unannotated protein n=1 Tax=freshwater metagenome TaxID=449393 RepID=A0A6J7ICX9_9ZZZZ
MPGGLEHASGEVDEFEAKLVADAGGEPAAPDALDGVGGDDRVVDHPEDLTDEEFDELEDRVDELEETFETGDQQAIERAEDELGSDISERRRERTKAGVGAPTRKGGLRFVAFLRASWAELQRVQWPDRRQVGQATAVVLGFVVIAGLYLGLADYVAKKVVDIII